VVVISGRTSVVRRPSWRTPRTPMRRSVSHLMREAIRAHQRSSKGHQMPAHLKRKPIRCHHQPQSEAIISRNPRPSSAAIRGHHQRQSEAIIRNQSLSGRLAYAISRNYSQSFAITRNHSSSRAPRVREPLERRLDIDLLEDEAAARRHRRIGAQSLDRPITEPFPILAVVLIRGAERAVVSACMQPRSSVAINVPW